MTTNKVCRRCKGKGYGPWVVDFGRCFNCLGTGHDLPKNKQFTVTVKNVATDKEEQVFCWDRDEAGVRRQVLDSSDSMYSVGFEIVSIA